MSIKKYATKGRNLLDARYLDEPLLSFGHGRLHPDPKIGISAYGPSSLGMAGKHPQIIKLGFIGTGRTLSSARQWVEQAIGGVLGDDDNLEFPGCSARTGFFSEVIFDRNWVEEITQNEMSSIGDGRTRRERFLACASLLDLKIQTLSTRDHPPDVVVIALPDELLTVHRKAIFTENKAQRVQYLREIVKARAMKHGMATQFLLEDTMDQARDEDLPSKKAWNFMTALYFKAGGVPWSPHGLPGGTCYVGISFYRAYADSPTVHTSLAQAFDETGESLILRGPEFQWSESEGIRSPHLDSGAAATLIGMVVERYEREIKRKPRRVVIHKTTRFDAAELDGFRSGLRNVSAYDFVAVQPNDDVRLIRAGRFPPLRGTWFSVGDADYLYTTGYIDCLRLYPAMHVPSPLKVTDHTHSDTERGTILREVLALSKMNWNSARFGGLLPVTLRFSRGVARILRELDTGVDPKPQFKFYY